MPSLEAATAALLEATDFSGAVRVDAGGTTLVAAARGLADRAHGIPNTLDTRFAVASATKGVTALLVVSLVVDGVLDLGTTARSLLGTDLPLVADDVTVGHLLAHRSGIGDYLDEEEIEEITDYVMPLPVHELDGAEAYLAVLDGHPMVSPPGQDFAYNNAGFVLLALLAERAAGTPYDVLVRERVAVPAGLTTLRLVRGDEPEARLAVGYLAAEGRRTNVLHLPVVGIGDGGLSCTVSDVHRLWAGFLAGDVVPPEWVARMTTPSGPFPAGERRYGLGFWLAPEGTAIRLEGYDAGISFRSVHDPAGPLTWTVVSNWSDGAWAVARELPGLIAAHG